MNGPVEQEWISYPEAERYSGLSHTTLWRYVSVGELKAARVGRSVRIHLPALRDFMEHASTEVADPHDRHPSSCPWAPGETGR